MKHNYDEKFPKIITGTLYLSLRESDQRRVREIAFSEYLSFQEFRQLCEEARDFEMWGEGHLDGDSETIRLRWKALKRRGPVYEETPPERDHRHPRIDYVSDPQATLFGHCPVNSEETRCCRLITLDAIRNCSLGCRYCSIQVFSKHDTIMVAKDLKEHLERFPIEPDQMYHVGTGQASDSLALGNEAQVLDILFEFAERHPNVILELKTKSNRIDPLLERSVPANVICTWSLNPPEVIGWEEHETASLEERLVAARTIANRGILVGFHLHPIIRHVGWPDHYKALVEMLLARFSSPEVALVSMGTLTYTRPVINHIRRVGGASKVLQMPFEEIAGKTSLPLGMKEELFKGVIRHFAPWRDEVFFYLCMEDAELWLPVLGHRFTTNEEFEWAMKTAYMNKIQSRRLKT